jgi:hypothetical protein
MYNVCVAINWWWVQKWTILMSISNGACKMIIIDRFLSYNVQQDILCTSTIKAVSESNTVTCQNTQIPDYFLTDN